MSQNSSLSGEGFELEQFGESDGHCDCCATRTKRVWGFVRRLGEPVGAYFVSWTDGKPDHGASFELILGRWGDDATKDDRFSVALDHRVIDGAAQFMIVDAASRSVSESPLVGTSLKRSDVVGTPLAAQVFAIVDTVYLHASLEDVRNWREHQGS
jgi:hypothetical protein